MKKYITTMVIMYIIILLLSIPIIIKSISGNTSRRTVVKNRHNTGLIITDQRVFDDADYLSDEEEADLEDEIERIKEDKEVDIVLVVADDLEGYEYKAYAEHFNDTHDFGYEDANGTCVLVLFDVSKAQYDDLGLWICTTGDARKYVTDSRCNHIFEKVKSTFKSGRTYDGFAKTLKYVDKYMNVPGFVPVALTNVFAQILISLLFGGIVLLILLNRRNVKMTVGDHTYLDMNSLKLNAKSDNYINTTTTRTRHSSSSSGGGGGGGGGGGHGGGGGRF